MGANEFFADRALPPHLVQGRPPENNTHKSLFANQCFHFLSCSTWFTVIEILWGWFSGWDMRGTLR